jgi:hypothetical protein
MRLTTIALVTGAGGVSSRPDLAKAADIRFAALLPTRTAGV